MYRPVLWPRLGVPRGPTAWQLAEPEARPCLIRSDAGCFAAWSRESGPVGGGEHPFLGWVVLEVLGYWIEMVGSGLRAGPLGLSVEVALVWVVAGPIAAATEQAGPD